MTGYRLLLEDGSPDRPARSTPRHRALRARARHARRRRLVVRARGHHARRRGQSRRSPLEREPRAQRPLRAPLTSSAALWPWIAAVLHFGVALVASAHAILYKRDVRAAIGWTGLIWLAPIAGSLLYWLLGINRIRRRAVRLEHPALVVRESTRVYAAGAAGSADEAPLAAAGGAGGARHRQPAPLRQPDDGARRRRRRLSGDARRHRRGAALDPVHHLHLRPRPRRQAVPRRAGGGARARSRRARADRRRRRPLQPPAHDASAAPARRPRRRVPEPPSCRSRIRTSISGTTARS